MATALRNVDGRAVVAAVRQNLQFGLSLAQHKSTVQERFFFGMQPDQARNALAAFDDPLPGPLGVLFQEELSKSSSALEQAKQPHGRRLTPWEVGGASFANRSDVYQLVAKFGQNKGSLSKESPIPLDLVRMLENRPPDHAFRPEDLAHDAALRHKYDLQLSILPFKNGSGIAVIDRTPGAQYIGFATTLAHLTRILQDGLTGSSYQAIPAEAWLDSLAQNLPHCVANNVDFTLETYPST